MIYFFMVPFLVSVAAVIMSLFGRTVALGDFCRGEGFCYTVSIPRPSGLRGVFHQWPGDDSRHPARSMTGLLEDGRPLSPPHAPHETIRARGGGGYSHWDNTLYFSASDGSDPRRNGRVYAIVLYPECRPWVFLSGLAGLVGIAASVASAWIT